jgi:hypothetical protein
MRRSPPSRCEWTCVDLGARAVRWLTRSAHSPEARLAPFEAPALVFLGAETSFVQEAARLGELEPEWLCRDLVTLLSERRGPAAPHISSEWAPPPRPYPASPRSALYTPGSGALRTAHGLRAPEAALAELMGELLSPSRVLGGSEGAPPPPSLAWLSSPGHAPAARLTLARLFDELGARRVAPIHAHAALAWGLSEQLERRALVSLKRSSSARLWATLDIGESQASLSLIRVDEPSRRLEVLAQFGRAQVGARAIEGALLDERLSAAGLAWEDLDPRAAARLERDAQERLYAALARRLPRHLAHSLDALPHLTPADEGVVGAALLDLTALAEAWLARALSLIGAPCEALDALWLTGSCALPLLAPLRRALPMVQVRVAPAHVALSGAARLVGALDSPEGAVDVREVALESVLLMPPSPLDAPSDGPSDGPSYGPSAPPSPPIALVSPGDPLPCWRELPLPLVARGGGERGAWGEGQGQICVGAEGEHPLWLPLPPPPPSLAAPRALRVCYEAPGSLSVAWR